MLSITVCNNTYAQIAPSGPTSQLPAPRAADEHEVLRPALLTPRDAGDAFIYLQAYHVKSEEFNSCLVAVRGMPQIEKLRQNGIKLRDISFEHRINPNVLRKIVNDSCGQFDAIITACARINVHVPDAAGFLEGHLCQHYRDLKYQELKDAKNSKGKKHTKRKKKAVSAPVASPISTPLSDQNVSQSAAAPIQNSSTPSATNAPSPSIDFSTTNSTSSAPAQGASSGAAPGAAPEASVNLSPSSTPAVTPPAAQTTPGSAPINSSPDVTVSPQENVTPAATPAPTPSTQQSSTTPPSVTMSVTG